MQCYRAAYALYGSGSLQSNVAGTAIAAFGLSLVAHDGVLALIAFVLTAILIALTTYLALAKIFGRRMSTDSLLEMG